NYLVTVSWIPSWLGIIYSKLYMEFTDREFTLDEAERVIKRSHDYVKVALSKLCKAGWCIRESKGKYKLLDPLDCILLTGGLSDALNKVPQKEYIPLLRRLIVEFLKAFRSSLLAVILFGSVARGTAHRTSDVDLLVVIRELPKSYLRRASLLADVIAKVREEKMKLWSKGIYVSVQAFAYTPEELKEFHAFYFDLAFDGIVLYSRMGYAERLLEDIRRRLRKMNVRKVVMPGGRWYWIVES
ncbi:MAG: hypothetical protein DRZ82_03600, partial [Thermoprotei archaeon]